MLKPGAVVKILRFRWMTGLYEPEGEAELVRHLLGPYWLVRFEDGRMASRRVDPDAQSAPHEYAATRNGKRPE